LTDLGLDQRLPLLLKQAAIWDPVVRTDLSETCSVL
jgi:hypothetical protein